MLVEKVVTANIRKVRNPIDRKMAGVFAADILTKGNIAPDLWGALLQEVIALFELPVEDGDDGAVEPMMEGYSNATAILTYATKATIDPGATLHRCVQSLRVFAGSTRNTRVRNSEGSC